MNMNLYYPARPKRLNISMELVQAILRGMAKTTDALASAHKNLENDYNLMLAVKTTTVTDPPDAKQGPFEAIRTPYHTRPENGDCFCF